MNRILIHAQAASALAAALCLGQTNPPVAPAPKAAAREKTKTAAQPKSAAAQSKQPMPPLKPDFKNLPAKSIPSNPNEAKLDQILLEWVRSYSSGGEPAAKGYVTKNHLVATGEAGRIPVRLIANCDPLQADKFVPKLLQQVRDLDGEITSHFENHIFVALPVKAVSQLMAYDTVWSMSAERTSVFPTSPPPHQR